MRVLLDTHLLLWALGSPLKLSAETRKLVDTSEVYVSAASIWEISIKAALGKLKADAAAVLAAIQPAGLSLLPITGEHAARVARLPAHHKDPFDRILIAQAVTEPMILLTNDKALERYGDLVQVV
ncbi:MAG: type II toxin-antitoxin system VapC family toxin [Gammaproteobacteria bacterium]